MELERSPDITETKRQRELHKKDIATEILRKNWIEKIKGCY